MNKIIVIIASIILISCSKEDETKTSLSSIGSSSVSSSCSTINAATTITHNGVNYKINALSGSNNSIGIEVINLTGPFTASYSAGIIQVNNGSNCFEKSGSIEGTPGLGKFFEYKSMPSWSISTSTLVKFKIVLDGTTYKLQDLHLDQN